MSPIEEHIILSFLDRVTGEAKVGTILSRQRLLYDLAEEQGYPGPRTKVFRTTDFRSTKQTITQTMNRKEGWAKYDADRKKTHKYGMAWVKE